MARYSRIVLHVPRVSARLAYAAKGLFGYWDDTGIWHARVPYRFHVWGETEEPISSDTLHFSYGLNPAPEGSIALPDSGLLWAEGTIPVHPEVRWLTVPVLFHAQDLQVDADLRQPVPFDVLAATFWLLSEYDAYEGLPTDAHGRYDPRETEWYQHQMWQYPLVPLWLAWLADKLEIQLQPQPPFRLEWTVDIDDTWRYRHKPLWRNIAAMLRDVARNEPDAAIDRFEALLHRRDPYDSFEFLTSTLTPAQLRFFALDSGSKLDNPYGFDHKPYRALLRSLQAKGYEVGLHPSYESLTHPELLQRETARLADVLGQQPNSVRMHYLKYRYPDTLRAQLAAGYTRDYTAASSYVVGFRHGLATPFLWFDAATDQETSLLRFPAQVMDRSLQKYLALSPAQALERTQLLIALTQGVGGTFRIIAHNSTFSRAFEWDVWEDWWRGVMQG
jgi:hypothetical protein